ncbi:MAG TPA: 30S ribosomal protein S17 [Thermoplasmata archaeon]|jgi:small subunit ribosomal protein S17|nr:30S ribosomal protein S17 [Thermoplasmata archaeon]
MVKQNAVRDIGIDVPKPAKGCEDTHCPFHGTLPVRGQSFEGVVVSTRMQRTAVVEREYSRYIRKFERYEKRTKRFIVHSPPCLELKEGDRVVLMECRPIAKTVAFVAIHNKGAAS